MTLDINRIPEYTSTDYVNNSEPDLDADHLNKTEQALKRVTAAANEAIEALKSLNTAKIDTAKIVNNALSTDPTTVLSGAMGKLLQDQLTRLNGDLGVIKFVRGDAPHVPGDENRNQAIKNFVDSLPNNSGIYIASFIFGSAYTLIIQKYSDISYASVFVFGYSVGQPIFLRKIVGEWV